MKATVKDILDILTQVEKIKTTQLLNADQRQTLLTELVQDIPLELFCHTSKGSRAAISEIIEREAKSVPPAGTQEALFLNSNGDTRGPRVKKAVVK